MTAALNNPSISVTSVSTRSSHKLTAGEAQNTSSVSPGRSEFAELKVLSPQQQAQLNRTRHGSESGVLPSPVREKHFENDAVYETKQVRSRSNSGNCEVSSRESVRPSIPSRMQQQSAYFGPRGYPGSCHARSGFTPDLTQRTSTSPGQGLKSVPNAWPFPQPSVVPRQQSEPCTSNYAAVFEKLSRVIDPEHVLPLAQAAINLSNSGNLKNADGGPLSEGDLVSYLMKLVHHFNETPDSNIAQMLRWFRSDPSAIRSASGLENSVAQEP